EASLSGSPRQGEIVVSGVKRGAWWAELEVRDKNSRELLGIARERFTVMTDLRGVPAPADFGAGYHGGLEFGDEVGFNWRGYWTLDDFFATNFQTGLRVQRDIFDWAQLEPERGRYVWDYLDARVEAARRNGCTTIICAPHKPLIMLPADYRKLLANPDDGGGRWLFKTAREINAHSVRSEPMGPAYDPVKRKLLFAPDPQALSDFMSALAARYDGKVDAIEFMNESNLYIDPEGLIDYYYKPGYPAMKQVAPNLPVLMNQTMDFAADGNGYTGQFLKLGGMDYSDGVFHHPYGVSQLEENGLEGIKTLERLRETYAKPGKLLLLGMSEIHGLGGGSRAFIRGEVVQRALLDWSAGCLWSAGALLTRNNFYEGNGPRMWFMRGASAPGVGAVHMNGLYGALGGYRFLRRIERDDNVLLMAFEKADGAAGRERYAVAIAGAQFPLTVSLLEADLRGIEFSAFDFSGERAGLPSSTEIRLGEGALYLRSNDARLFDRLGAGRVAWGQSITGKIEERVGATAETVLYTTGVPPAHEEECGVVDRWTLLDGVRDANAYADDFPIREKITTEDGTLIWPMDKTRRFDQPLPYVLLSADNASETVWHRAHTSVEAARAGEITWYFSATGPAILWLNGTRRIDLSDLPGGLVGATWRSFTVPLAEGINHILVQVASRGAPSAFALSANREAINNAPVAVDGDGFIRKWKIIGPWKNWRNNEGKFRGNDFAFPPESRTDFNLHATGLRKMPLIWHEASYATPVIPHPWVDGISYAQTVVQVGEDTPCLASVGSDDGFALWINGTSAGRNAVSRVFKMDSDKVPVVLKKGRNQVLFKIDDTGGAGAFSVRFVHKDGRPVDLTVVD
ncbi:MAG TPA: beta-galactosidase, partial [Rariglobus sp.]